MPDLPESGIRLVAETDDFNRGMRDVLDIGGEFDTLASDVIGSVDEMASAFDSFDPTIEIPDAELPFDAIPEEVSTVVDVEESEDSKDTWEIMKGLAAGIAVWTAIINVGGAILDVLAQIQSFTLDPILDVEDAMARFEAQTGRTSDGLDEIINRLHFTADVGEGFDDITNVLITGNRLGIDSYEQLEEAALGALQTAKSQGVDAVATLRTMQILVDQGLAGSYTEAADLVTAAIQNGNDRAGDLFQTISQFGPMFAEMGLDGSEAMSLINSGLDAGFRSASDVARAIDTMNKNITGAEPGSAIDDALSSIGVDLPEQGEQVGEEFFNSIIEGIQAHPEAADTAIEAIFGGRADKVSEAFGDLTLEDSAFEDLEGRAEEAATAIDNSLRGVFDDFVLWIQGEISKLLNSTEVDVPGKLEELRTRLQAALAAIQSGEGFGEALEVALQIPGLNDTFQRIESGFGNFEIVLLQVVASLADLIGQAEVATAAREEVTRLAENQLTFDLTVADNGEEITNAVQAAIERGVRLSDIQESVHTAIGELITQGDIDEAQRLLDSLSANQAGEETARQFVDTFAASVEGTVSEDAIKQILGVDNIREASADAIVEFRDEINQAFADTNWITSGSQINVFDEQVSGYLATWRIVTGEIETLQAQIDSAQEQLIASTQSAPVDPTAIRALTAPMDDAATSVEENFDRINAVPQELAYQFQTHMPTIQTATQTAADAVILSADQIATSIEDADERINQAVIGGSIVPDIRLIASTALAAFPQVVAPAMLMAISVQLASSMVSAGLMSIRNTAAVAMPQAAGFVNNLTQEIYGLGDTAPILDSIISKLQQLASIGTQARDVLNSVASAGAQVQNVTNNNTNVTVNQTNNVQSGAQAASLGFANSRAIRGFG
jgi:hypothetical protein